MNETDISIKKQKTFLCEVCKKHFTSKNLLPVWSCKSNILEIIFNDVGLLNTEWYICSQDLARYRSKYIENILEQWKGELNLIEKNVVDSIKNEEILAENINAEYDKNISFWEKVSDKIAEFWWSWAFLISFWFFIFLWILINIFIFFNKPFDPYPFILLNLILSCLASVQAPIIMMSQNRQEVKDRMRAQNDYMVNLKAELEIRHINEKLDHLINNQWWRLIEIQRIQMDLIEEMKQRKRY